MAPYGLLRHRNYYFSDNESTVKPNTKTYYLLIYLDKVTINNLQHFCDGLKKKNNLRKYVPGGLYPATFW